MRRLLIYLALIAGLALPVLSRAAEGRVIKVLPQFLDSEGRNSLTPSLFERDVYQDKLRHHPENRSALRFCIQWKAKGHAAAQLKIRVEVRGVPQKNTPREVVFEQQVKAPTRFSRWTKVSLSGEAYKKFGEMTAWRVTLWEGDKMLAEQKSFLW
jgi:hypothetical protein